MTAYKHCLGITTLAIVSVLAFAGCSSQPQQSSRVPQPASPTSSVAENIQQKDKIQPGTELVGEDKAMEVVMRTADGQVQSASNFSVAYNEETNCYDVSFKTSERSFVYEVDAHTGEVASVTSSAL